MKTITIGGNIFQIYHSCHLKPIILSIFFCLFRFFVLFLEEEGFLSVKFVSTSLMNFPFGLISVDSNLVDPDKRIPNISKFAAIYLVISEFIYLLLLCYVNNISLVFDVVVPVMGI